MLTDAYNKMIETYVIYTILFILLVCYGFLVQSYRKNKVIIFIAIFILLIYSLIEGFRYEVGTDWNSYKDFYTSLLNSGICFNNAFDGEVEPVYIFINLIISKIELPYQFVFGIIAAIQVILFTLVFKGNRKFFTWGMFFYAVEFLLPSQNIMRQTLSSSIFIFSLYYLLIDEKLKYCIGSFVSFLTHYSSIITIPCVILKNNIFKWLDNRNIGIILLFSSFFMREFLTNSIINGLPLISQNEKYISNLNLLDVVHEYNSGWGVIYRLFMAIFLAVYLKRLIIYFKSDKITVVYRIFLIGTILQNAFANSMLLCRVPFALVQTKILLYPILFSFLWKNGNLSKLLVIGLSIIFLSGYFISIKNGYGGAFPFIIKF